MRARGCGCLGNEDVRAYHHYLRDVVSAGLTSLSGNCTGLNVRTIDLSEYRIRLRKSVSLCEDCTGLCVDRIDLGGCLPGPGAEVTGRKQEECRCSPYDQESYHDNRRDFP